MLALKQIDKSFCISSNSQEDKFQYSFNFIDSSLVSPSEFKKFFKNVQGDNENIYRLLSHYQVWKKLSQSKKDQLYFVFEGEARMNQNFSTLWNNFINKSMPKNFSICLLGDFKKSDINPEDINSENNLFFRFKNSNKIKPLNSTCYIISKSAANLICHYINAKGFNLNLDSFLFNFFTKNDFFSNPESIVLAKEPLRDNLVNTSLFMYDEDVLFDKRLKMVDMRTSWQNLLNPQDFEKFLLSQSNLPKIKDYPTPPKETFSCYNPGKRIALVTLYTPENSRYAYQCEISLKNYCHKHDYTLYVYRDSIDKTSFPSWSKPDALLNHIQDHEIISWFDSDTLIFNPSKKIEWIVDNTTKYKEFIFSEDIGGHNYINSGVFFCRNADHTILTLEKWQNFKVKNDTSTLFASGGDQKVLGDIIKKIDVYKYFHKIFPMSEFNTDPRLVSWDTFVIHFMSYPKHLKEYFMNFWNFGFPIYK